MLAFTPKKPLAATQYASRRLIAIGFHDNANWQDDGQLPAQFEEISMAAMLHFADHAAGRRIRWRARYLHTRLRRVPRRDFLLPAAWRMMMAIRPHYVYARHYMAYAYSRCAVSNTILPEFQPLL